MADRDSMKPLRVGQPITKKVRLVNQNTQGMESTKINQEV